MTEPEPAAQPLDPGPSGAPSQGASAMGPTVAELYAAPAGPFVESATGPAADFVSSAALEAELKRVEDKRFFRGVVRSTLLGVVVLAAVAVLIAALVFPVLVINGSSMADELNNGDVVVATSTTDPSQGDLVAFYHGNDVLVRRVVAGPGDTVDIDEDGNVSVNGQPLDEPYVKDKSRGQCDVELPFQVPEGKYFVMGDHRSTSLDSRSTQVGCISPDDIVGRLVLRVWPLEDIGPVE